MFLTPIDRADKKAWDNLTFYDNGRYYAFFGTGMINEENPDGYPIGLDIAASDDGVHWEFIARNILHIKGAHAGFGVKRIGDYIYYYPTCTNSLKGVHFKIYRSKNMTDWEHLGDEYDVVPDRRWYHERWDEMMLLEDMENGRKVYYGYISSETREDIGEPGCGVLKTYDGIHWEILPPLKIDWGELPGQHMELNFAEKIGENYYLSMSGRFYMNSLGYSLYTFVGKTPYGPFQPDLPMFRLCGNSGRDVTWLGHSFASPGGLLAALWLSCEKEREIPSSSFAIGALKRILCQNGHLRFGYWDGNEAAKGENISIDMAKAICVHPDEKGKSERDAFSITNSGITISASRDGVVILLPAVFSREKGFIIEGKVMVKESRQHISSHHHAAAAGFYFESDEGYGTATIAETLGVTRTGVLSYSGHKITDFNIYAHAGRGLVSMRSGELSGTLSFHEEDCVGPLGHASFCGIRHGKEHRFRILARRNYYELYIDDLYVQTYILPDHMTGRFGIMAFDGTACYTDIKAWQMN